MKKELFSLLDKIRGPLDQNTSAIELLRMAQVTLSENNEGHTSYDKKRVTKKVQDQKLNLSWGINSFMTLDEDAQKKLFEIFTQQPLDEIRKVCLETIRSQDRHLGNLSFLVTKDLLSKFNSDKNINIIFADTIIEHYELINKLENAHLYFKYQGCLPLANLLFDKHIALSAYSNFSDFSFEGNNFIHLGPFNEKANLERNNFSKFCLPKGAFQQEVEIAQLISNNSKSRILAVVPASITFTHSSKYFRDILLNETHVNSIEELPPKSFSSIGIQTFMLDIGGQSVKKKIRIQAHDKSSIEITRDQLADHDEWNLLRFYSTGYHIDGEIVDFGSIIKESFRGPNVKKAESGDKLYYISNKDLKNNNYIDCNELEEEVFETNRTLDRYYLQDGDILLVCRGFSFEAAVMKNIGTKKVICSQNIVAIRINQKTTDSYFLYLFLTSPLGQAELKARQSGTIQIVLSVKDIKTIKIPMLSLKEQKEISNEFLTATNKRDQALRNIEKEFEENTQKMHSKMRIINEK